MNTTLVERVAEDLRTALETGAVSRDNPTEGMQLVVDLLRAAEPDAVPPARLDGFSLLCGAAYILGAKLASQGLED